MSDTVQDWYFTWGHGQTLPDGTDAMGRYVVIPGTWLAARMEMIDRFGGGWCDQYESADRAGVAEFRLVEVNRLLFPRIAEGS